MEVSERTVAAAMANSSFGQEGPGSHHEPSPSTFSSSSGMLVGVNV